MKKFLKTVCLPLFLLFLKINIVFAQSWSNPSGEQPAKFEDLEIIFGNILGVILSLAGVAIFIMLIMAGFKFLTAGGNPEQAKSAKATMTWAIIGLVVMLVVWFIMRLIEEFTGVKVTEFEIPGNREVCIECMNDCMKNSNDVSNCQNNVCHCSL